MPTVHLKFKKDKVTADFIGFEGKSCEFAQQDIVGRLKELQLNITEDRPKYDEIGEAMHEQV